MINLKKCELCKGTGYVTIFTDINQQIINTCPACEGKKIFDNNETEVIEGRTECFLREMEDYDSWFRPSTIKEIRSNNDLINSNIQWDLYEKIEQLFS